MQQVVLTKEALVTGEDSLEYLGTIPYTKAIIVTGGHSMARTGVLDKIKTIMKGTEENFSIYSGISKNPTDTQVLDGVEYMKKEKPDVVLAVGGGSSIDAAKVMVLMYEYPELNFDNVYTTDLSDKKLKTKLIAVPSTSGTASEVTQISVITGEKTRIKMAIKSEYIRPAVAILDGSIPETLPAHIAAETGMDAMTHALEAYINKNGNDFTYALAKEAIEGIMEWLPISFRTASLESRSKVHNFQCMAGMAFGNSGLGIVHGVSHAFGGQYNLAHGLVNAIILPYSMDYNKKDPEVQKKYDKLSHILGGDVIQKVKELRESLEIPASICDAGVDEETYQKDYQILVDHSMLGSTAVNPIPVSREDMEKFVDCVYYGREVDF